MERKQIGTLFGHPIYESDDPRLNSDEPIVVIPFTKEMAEEVQRRMAAESLAKKLVDESPKEGI